MDKIENLKKVLSRCRNQYQIVANNFVAEVKGVAVKVLLKVGGGSFCTNGEDGAQSIVVSVVEEWIEWFSTATLRFVVIPYLLMHECGHARFTDDWFAKACEDGVKYCQDQAAANGKGLPIGFLQEVSHFIVNSLEDGRIERIDALRFKGFDEGRKMLRGKLWATGGYSEIAEPEMDRIFSTLNCILTLATTWKLPKTGSRVGLGRYQKGATEFFRKNPECLDILRQCKPHIVKAINADKCQGIYEPSMEIMKLLYPLIEDAMALSADEARLMELLANLIARLVEDHGNQGKMMSKEEKETVASQIKGTGSGKMGNSVSSGAGGDNSSNDSCDGGAGEEDEESLEDASESGESDEDFENELSDYICDAEQKQTSPTPNANGGMNMRRSQKAIEEAMEDILAGVAKEEDFSFQETHQDMLQTFPICPEKLLEAKAFKKFLDNIVRNKSTHDRTNMKRGKLNTHQISKICMGQDTFFKQMGRPYKASMAVYILKDNSGSMSGEKHEESCRALSVLEYAMSGYPLKCVAFETNSYDAEHTIIKDWNETSNTISYSETFFQNNTAGGGNSDGADIIIATEELKRRPENDKLLIILSDGAPSAYNSERDAYGSVAYAVRKARKAGIKVVSIFFGPEEFLNESSQAYIAMYSQDIVGVTPDKISAELQKILKKQFR